MRLNRDIIFLRTLFTNFVNMFFESGTFPARLAMYFSRTRGNLKSLWSSWSNWFNANHFLGGQKCILLPKETYFIMTVNNLCCRFWSFNISVLVCDNALIAQVFIFFPVWNLFEKRVVHIRAAFQLSILQMCRLILQSFERQTFFELHWNTWCAQSKLGNWVLGTAHICWGIDSCHCLDN